MFLQHERFIQRPSTMILLAGLLLSRLSIGNCLNDITLETVETASVPVIEGTYQHRFHAGVISGPRSGLPRDLKTRRSDFDKYGLGNYSSISTTVNNDSPGNVTWFQIEGGTAIGVPRNVRGKESKKSKTPKTPKPSTTSSPSPFPIAIPLPVDTKKPTVSVRGKRGKRKRSKHSKTPKTPKPSTASSPSSLPTARPLPIETEKPIFNIKGKGKGGKSKNSKNPKTAKPSTTSSPSPFPIAIPLPIDTKKPTLSSTVKGGKEKGGKHNGGKNGKGKKKNSKAKRPTQTPTPSASPVSSSTVASSLSVASPGDSFGPSEGTLVFSGADSAALSQSFSSHPSTISPELLSQFTETDLQLANQTTFAGQQLLNQAAVAVAGVGVSDYSGSTRANDDEVISKEGEQSLNKAKRKRRPRKHKEVQT